MAAVTQKASAPEKRWSMTTMPNFEGMKCHVLGGAFHGSILDLMKEVGFDLVKTPEEASIIVFAGGADVDPELYGQKRLPFTHYHRARDDYEGKVYDEAVELGKPMFGICRGAQFLHVKNKGQLWQHVENHAGPDHDIWDLEDEVLIRANSYHHQMLCLNDRIEVLACTAKQVSNLFVSDTMTLDLNKEGANADQELEIEAGMYYDTKCFFVQGHPEVGDPEYRSWTMTKLKEFLDEVLVVEDEEVYSIPDSNDNMGEEELDPTTKELVELERVMLESESDEEVEMHMAQWRAAQGYSC